MESTTHLILRKRRIVQMQQILARLRTLLNQRFQGEDRTTLLLMISALERLSKERFLRLVSADMDDEDSGETDRFVEEKLQRLEDQLFA